MPSWSCPNCGRENAPADEVCSGCLEPRPDEISFEPDPTPASPGPKQPLLTTRTWLWIGGGFLLGLLLLGYGFRTQLSGAVRGFFYGLLLSLIPGGIGTTLYLIVRAVAEQLYVLVEIAKNTRDEPDGESYEGSIRIYQATKILAYVILVLTVVAVVVTAGTSTLIGLGVDLSSGASGGGQLPFGI